MEQKKNNFLETEKISTLMARYAVPCIISLLVAALYNIVDQIFIANADYLGSYGNAANTVVYPLTIISLSIAVMIGDGSNAFIGLSLGAGRNKDASKTVGNAIALTLSASVILMAIYFIFQNQLIALFGGTVNDETFKNSKEYLVWITAGLPFYMFGQTVSAIINADGSPKYAMASTLSGAFTNIVLDPVFIFIFKWGMKGAAIATVLGQIVTACIEFRYLFRLKATKLEKSSFILDFKIIKRFIPLGITSFLSQIALVFSMAAMNNMLKKYGAMDPIFGLEEYSQIPIAVVGIVMKFFQVVISITIGFAAGCIPIASYNIGAGRKDRAKELFKKLILCEFLVGLVALIIVEFFPKQIIGLFGASNESAYYTEFALKAFRIYLCLLPLATINKSMFIFLQAIGKAVESTILSLIREIVLGVGLAILLPVFFGLDGTLYSMPVSDFLTFLVTIFLIRNTMKSLSDDKPATKNA